MAGATPDSLLAFHFEPLLLGLVPIYALGGISLVLLTTYLHHTTVDLENSLQGVRLAEEMQIDLLNYVRSESESEKLKLENALRRALSESRRYVGSPDEGEALSDAARFLDMHFQTSRTGKEPPRGNLRAAFGALERFVNINIEQANDSLRESERLDELGDRIGITVGIVLAIGTTAILIWLSKVAFRPVFGIRDAMKEFATGRRNVRAPVHGPRRTLMADCPVHDFFSLTSAATDATPFALRCSRSPVRCCTAS